MIKNEIIIQLHYNFINNDNHLISFYTRNTCSIIQAEIISYIIKSLYPNEDFELLSLPPQNGSFEDNTVVKFINRNPGLVALLSALLPLLFYGYGQVKVDLVTADLRTLEVIEKCKNFSLDDEMIKKVDDICNSYYPKKQKNIFYQTILSDKNIVGIKPIIVSNNKNIFEKEIEKIDFVKYIEEIPKAKEFLKTDLSGNIQLLQPFIYKQEQYGRGVAWKGIYYGKDVFDDNNELIIEDGEYVFFYMQDDEFKNKILKQEISFTSGDNIRIIFDIGRYYDYVNGRFGKARLYVKRVESYNDNLVQHKKELALKKAGKQFKEEHKNQASFFDITQYGDD